MHGYTIPFLPKFMVQWKMGMSPIVVSCFLSFKADFTQLDDYGRKGEFIHAMLVSWNLFVPYFWASTLQNKVFSNQNKGHLGSRLQPVTPAPPATSLRFTPSSRPRIRTSLCKDEETQWGHSGAKHQHHGPVDIGVFDHRSRWLFFPEISFVLSQKTNSSHLKRCHTKKVSFVFHASILGGENMKMLPGVQVLLHPKDPKVIGFWQVLTGSPWWNRKIKVPLFSRDSSMYPTNVPLWQIPISAIYSGYLWVLIPKNP